MKGNKGGKSGKKLSNNVKSKLDTTKVNSPLKNSKALDKSNSRSVRSNKRLVQNEQPDTSISIPKKVRKLMDKEGEPNGQQSENQQNAGGQQDSQDRNERSNQDELPNSQTFNSDESVRDDVIVGSAKSLIRSIKKNKERTKLSQEKEKQKQQVGGESSQEITPPKDSVETEEEMDQNDGDGVDLMVCTPDNYSDHSFGENSRYSSSESESEYSFDSEDSDRDQRRRRSYKNSDSESESDSDGSFEPRQFNNNSKGESSCRGSAERGKSPVQGTDSSDDEYEKELRKLKKDPQVKRLYKLMQKDEKRKKRMKERQRDKRSKRSKGKRNTEQSVKKAKVVQLKNLIKSPSDMTLYTPALRKVADNSLHNNLMLYPHRLPISADKTDAGTGASETIQQISEFVENMRVDHDRRDRDDSRRSDRSRERSATPRSRQGESDQQTPGEQLILDAEKFKASVSAPPQGMVFNNNSDSQKLDQILDYIKQNQDEEFYHITSHVDAKLKQRIQKGEFIELEILIPKNRGQLLREDQRLQQFVMKNGATYWAPPEKEFKISNLKKWEQAFRVYAAIYCQSNPHKAVEIWQYIHTINAAAGSFAWENVYYYDVTFRQMIADKPYRSWAKTYSQLWHAAMCDPLPKLGSGSGIVTNAGQGENVDWRDRCCWRYNRGKCRKWNCSFDHRCTFCGSYSHNNKSCTKRISNNGGKQYGKERSRSRSPDRKQKKDKRK